MGNDDLMHSKREICRRMHIGNERFFSWLEMGAPIACEHGPRGRIEYTAHVRDLQAWRASIFTWRKLQNQDANLVTCAN